MASRVELPEQLLDPSEADLGTAADVGRLGMVGEHPAIERGRRDIDAGGTKVGHQDVARVAPERELARRTAPGARPDLTLHDQSPVEQLAHTLRHDPASEARVVHQLGARPGAAQPDVIEDGDQRVERIVGHGHPATRPSGSRRVA